MAHSIVSKRHLILNYVFTPGSTETRCFLFAYCQYMLVYGVTELPELMKMPDVHLLRAPLLVYLKTCSLFITIFHTSLTPCETFSRMNSLNALPCYPYNCAPFWMQVSFARTRISWAVSGDKAKAFWLKDPLTFTFCIFSPPLKQDSSFFRNLVGSVSQQ